MPFGKFSKKQLNRSLRPTQRYGYYKSQSKTKKVAAKVNYLYRSIETKLHDVSATLQCAYDAPCTSLTLIAEGPTSHTRNGLMITPFKLDIRGYLTWSAATGTTAMPVRIIIFKDRDNRGAIPLVSDVLEGTGIQSPYNHLNKKRFQILIDRTIDNKAPVDPAAMTGRQSLRITKSLKGKVNFLTSTAVQTGQGKGTIYMLPISNTNLAGTPSYYTMTSRLSYRDA